MKDIRLYLALTLCALASVAAVFGGAPGFTVVTIGAFVIFAPGLVLTHLLRIGDSLLSVVIMMMTGPSLWVAIATVAAFSGLWAPTPTVVGAATLLALACLWLLRTELVARPGPSVEPNRHRFVAHPAEEGALDAPGRHRLPLSSRDES